MTVKIVFCLLIFLFTTVLLSKITTDQQTVKLQTYTLETQEIPTWSTRLVAMMQTKGVHKSLHGTREQPNEPASLPNGASNFEMKNHKMLKDAHEKEVEDTEMFKDNGNNVWCHMPLTLEATLQLKESEHLDCFFIIGKELLKRLQEAGEANSETLFNSVVLNGLPVRYESFVIQESFNPATNFIHLMKRLQNVREILAQGYKGQNGSVALPVRRDCTKGPKRINCFVCVRSHDTLPRTE